MNEVILYSTGCPKCKILKKRLDDKGIVFTEDNNIEKMLSLDINAVPVLFVDGMRMEFKEAIDWANAQ